MSQIASLTSNQDDWGSTASSYLQQWKTLAINNNTETPHTTLSYGDNSSHGEPDPSLHCDFMGPSDEC